MRRYREAILDLLLDKYEKSKSFIGTNIVNQSFSVQLDKFFPEYTDDSKINEIQEINEAVTELESKEFIRCKRHRNGLIYAASLNTDKIGELYAFLRRKPKADLNYELLSLFEKYKGNTLILSEYCSRQIQRIHENKKIEHFNGNIAELEQVLMALGVVSSLEQETFERDFSIRVFGDSKVFEKIRSTVESILYEYGDFPEKESLLEDLNLVRNPGHVFFKGAGVVTISGQSFDLRRLNGDIAVSSAMLKDIDRFEVTGRSVITIENLTSFNAYVPQDELVIYLGGYHNRARRDFIASVYKQNPEVEYYHCGDIDAGGFYILLHLRKKTGIHFKPLHMDVETLKANIIYAKRLTENDARRLKGLIGNDFDEVIEYMLEHNCKLEQEVLD